MDSAGRWRGETSVAGVHGHQAPQMNSFKFLAQDQALMLEQASAATAAAMATAAKAAAAVSLWQRQRRRQVGDPWESFENNVDLEMHKSRRS
jgi:hypothetical protein